MTLHTTEYEKEQQEKISNELSKYSINVFDDFRRTFPCKGLLAMTIFYKYNIGVNNISDQPQYNYVGLVYDYDGSQKFWKDWNRFKNLKAFL